MAAMPDRFSSNSATPFRAGGTSRMLTPFRPARPVRPERCCMTFRIIWQIRMNDEVKSRAGRCRAPPRRVATQTRERPSRKACRAWVRSLCVNSPERATTEKPRSRSAVCKCLTASLVFAKHKRAGDSKKRNTLTTACSTSLGAIRMARYSIRRDHLHRPQPRSERPVADTALQAQRCHAEKSPRTTTCGAYPAWS